MKILMTGATGFLGKALIPTLRNNKCEIVRLRRTGAGPGEPVWDPDGKTIDAAALEGFDGIIHLAGESIAGLRWTDAKKRRIRDSRVEGTKLLADAAAGLSKPPRWMVCASAVGYYGDRGNELLTEDSAPGTGFLAEVCRAWEAASEPAARRGIRLAHLRTGVVLGREGGVLPRMMIPFKLGIGGKVGSGKQYMPWISIDDAAGAVAHIIEKELSGPFNLAAPGTATNGELSKELGRALHRPAAVPLPAFAARLVMGEMADALLLAGQRVEPAALLKSGYRFKHPQLAAALHHILG